MRYCSKCGAHLGDHDVFCSNCGEPAAVQECRKICPYCGTEIREEDQFCSGCGAATGNPGPVYQGQVVGSKPRRSKLVAGLLGIFVGGFGIHNFYLGNISMGVIQIVVTLLTCGVGSIWGFIEGILILCDKITRDGDGNPLEP